MKCHVSNTTFLTFFTDIDFLENLVPNEILLTFIMLFTGPKDDIFPPFLMYDGKDSFFGGEAPLSQAIGYLVVLGFGLFFSVFTSCIMQADKMFGKKTNLTSEHFK